MLQQQEYAPENILSCGSTNVVGKAPKTMRKSIWEGVLILLAGSWCLAQQNVTLSPVDTNS
jgi:hypothetical protein